ncbi:MAG TPA: DUF2179 domain-containing protein [Williamwhitmania sp.]|nr:DUF2179 domain-containing protein [Williamwhitmania sp.]
MSFTDSNLFVYLLLPLIIFFARICDVTIGTMRIILVSKGQRNIAPFLGFFEVFIWILAIGQIMSHLNNFFCYIGYAAGFATGNYIGMLVEEKVAMGTLLIRIITPKDATELLENLHTLGYGATSFDATGRDGKVNIIYTIVNRTQLKRVEEVIMTFNPHAFYSIEDLRSVKNGILPGGFPASMGININPLKRWRRGK